MADFSAMNAVSASHRAAQVRVLQLQQALEDAEIARSRANEAVASGSQELIEARQAEADAQREMFRMIYEQRAVPIEIEGMGTGWIVAEDVSDEAREREERVEQAYWSLRDARNYFKNGGAKEGSWQHDMLLRANQSLADLHREIGDVRLMKKYPASEELQFKYEQRFSTKDGQ